MKRHLLTLVLLLLLHGTSLACTSAIVSVQRSSEGVPLLWKHRDNTKTFNTRVAHITGGKYAYTAVVPNGKRYATGAYAGINEKGFGVMTTATSNLPESTVEEYEACKRPRLQGGAMWNGLRECETIAEFEEMLKTTKRNRRSHSNFGVGDATGAVAYFEVWDLGYRRYDISESGNDGFDVRTNFSQAGNPKKKGSSKRRYDLIIREMSKHCGEFSPCDFIGYSRSYNSVKYGDVLSSDNSYTCNNHTVPRYSSVGSFVIVCDAKNPRMLVMNGHPVSSIAVPVYVKAKDEIPQCVKVNTMQMLSNDFRQKAYIKNEKNRYVLNKAVISKVLKIKHPKIEMLGEMPENIHKFNAEIDKHFAKHKKKVCKVLDKF